MLKILPAFLVENNAKLLIKYDGERIIKQYTIRILFNDLNFSSLGKDTDSPYSLLSDIFKENKKILDEVLNFFSNEIMPSIENTKDKFGDKCIMSVLLEERNNNIIYTLHIQTVKGTKHDCGINYIELHNKMLMEEI
ncbi:MAG: hypothetical protein J1E62_04525 [Lachnospiraceae bacterium]|nr:hypothetical protein [Lachnospiraceae bacterium]